MQRGRGGRDDLFNFGDPFGGGFGDHRSLMSNFFGGRDPFDDPFFSRPLGSSIFGGSSMFGGSNMFGGSSMFGPSVFGPSMFGGRNSSPFGNESATGFIDNQPQQGNRSRGLVIEEIKSDDEDDGEGETEEKKEKHPRKHSRSSEEPYVEDPDEGPQERRIRPMQQRNDFNRVERNQPETRSFSFQSSTVTYGGMNGAYYTSSTARRMGDDGVVVEESKEADTTTGKAKHRLSRGIHDKGHTVTRKLNPDGKVNTMQTLHNLNEDELPVFEEAWKGNAAKKLPGWNEGFGAHGGGGPSSSQQHEQASRGGWALPSAEQSQYPERREFMRRNPAKNGLHQV